MNNNLYIFYQINQKKIIDRFISLSYTNTIYHIYTYSLLSTIAKLGMIFKHLNTQCNMLIYLYSKSKRILCGVWGSVYVTECYSYMTSNCANSPSAWGMRWRNASPSKPPDAKLKSTLRSFWCWSVFDCTGMRKRMRKGAALMSRVAPIA